ncbi:hypothetical protein A2814_01470 [Candidatus Nomurabacteria bacterium RIFCSPHIGHO2_01_FULL_38_19]|uniref:Uncharacterized protein n=1 Tax=Candidatus Nomurabacteria bacterium RIFCSPHIGHO2_01_FULL_38_19 TaxID=1801732 RepID=A0A1F6URE3_9BACT|nr:MAG: hypothetical protein A2814_01470 [Candidatus Nomurabacteria bacterium RIFCSPHIGHO2_01_FULL_38_19]
MIAIKDLLANWSNALLSEELKIKAVNKVLQQVIGIKIENRDIQIKNNTVYLNVKPIYKNEIFINKKEITSLLEKTLGKKAPKDVR